VINFDSLPTWLLIVGFLVSAGVVYASGFRLSRYADSIARQARVGHAMIGVILLGGVTSLPEIAVSGSAAFNGNAAMAVNNLLGGFTMQVTVLAIADIAIRRSALTAVVPDPSALLQGALGILLVALTIVGVAAGDVAFAGASAWTWAIAAVFVYAIRTILRAEKKPSWQVIGEPPSTEIDQPDPGDELSGVGLLAATCLAALLILLAGYALSSTGEILAERSGLGDSFFGAVFIAITTSLPEISTVLAAVRLGRYVMAVSDIFGTNLFDIGVIFLADLAYPGGPVLNQVGSFAIVAGLLGILVTAIYLAGLIERRDLQIAGIGVDSIAVVATYLGGVGLLYGLR
jgi:cation:H+ antiporter